ncbi:MAG: OFA family MFS transporter [Peptococcaceae bacterium]|jgi:OFA family oxalate/formate antiporter-like MFS transporter|nr:OFA family MFS transporter [Peptococcaceae bacterium]MDH7526348.1 OFA family MFS transporter [Peptococcaceae bacterium]
MGIKKRWGYVLAGFIIMLVLGLIYAWSVFVLPLEKEFGWERDQTSLTFSLSMIFFSAGLMLGGALVDKKGPRLVTLTGGVLVCLGFVLASFTRVPLHLYLSYSIVGGVSSGVVYNCVLATAVRWFPDRRGLVSGLLMMGFGLGGMVLGSGASMIIQLMGWRNAFKILGLINLLVIILLGQFLRNPPEPGRPSAGSAEKPVSFQTGKDYDWPQVLRQPLFWSIWLWAIANISGGLTAIGHIVPFAAEKGIEENLAVLAMGVLSVSNGAGRIMFGYFSDRLGRKTCFIMDALTMMLALFLLATSLGKWGFKGLFVSAVLAGIAYGGVTPQLSSAMAGFFGQKHFGANFGLISTSIGAASLFGPYLSGYLKTSTGVYEMSFYFLAAIALFSSVIAVIFIKEQ